MRLFGYMIIEGDRNNIRQYGVTSINALPENNKCGVLHNRYNINTNLHSAIEALTFI